MGFASHADVERVNAEIMTAKKSWPEPNLRTEETTRGGIRLELRGVFGISRKCTRVGLEHRQGSVDTA